MKATAGDDCRVASADVEIQLWNEKATTIGPGPFQWDVAGLSGEQTVTVTVTDGTGKTASASISVRLCRLASQCDRGRMARCGRRPRDGGHDGSASQA